MPSLPSVARTLGVVAATSIAVGAATPAHAADSYRYWGYYQLQNMKWTFATKGVAESVPADRAVEGFRYAVGDGSVQRNPRALQTFDEICAKTPAQAGKKRVGVIVDFGRPADARDKGATVPKPFSKCAVVATTATAADVVAAVGTPRIENKMLCAINGYPATGCSDVVKTLTPEQKAADDVVALPDPSAPTTQATTAAAQQSSSSGGSNTSKYLGILAGALAAGAVASYVLGRRKTTH